MAEKHKNPGRKELLTDAINDLNSSRHEYESVPKMYPVRQNGVIVGQEPWHTPRVQNSMLDKLLGFLLGPNNHQISRGEIPFVPGSGVIGGIERAGEETAITKEMMERFAEQRAADVAKAQAARDAILKQGRPNDFPIGTIREVAPKTLEVGPPAGRLPTMNIPLEEMFRKLLFGGQ